METTHEQERAISRLWNRDNQGLTLGEFRETVEQGYGCLMVAWSGMVIGIEKDGYTHS